MTNKFIIAELPTGFCICRRAGEGVCEALWNEHTKSQIHVAYGIDMGRILNLLKLSVVQDMNQSTNDLIVSAIKELEKWHSTS